MDNELKKLIVASTKLMNLHIRILDGVAKNVHKQPLKAGKGIEPAVTILILKVE